MIGIQIWIQDFMLYMWQVFYVELQNFMLEIMSAIMWYFMQ